jgi:hypothetical protein
MTNYGSEDDDQDLVAPIQTDYYSNGKFGAGIPLDIAGRSVPQLRHEPITCSILLPQLTQFSTFESDAGMLSYAVAVIV